MFKSFIAFVLVATSVAFGQQNTLVQTSLSAAIDNARTVITVASATNITNSLSAPTGLFVGSEYMLVIAVNGLNITVARGQSGTAAVAHPSGEMVLSGRPQTFYTANPQTNLPCTSTTVYVTPWVNIMTGQQWTCSSVLSVWTPSWNNPVSAVAARPSTAVASAAGLVTPTGPLFHITGVLAITGFNVPLGFSAFGGSFCVVPDAIFTWTAANNIGLAGTAVVGKQLCFVYDGNSAKFYPSYIA